MRSFVHICVPDCRGGQVLCRECHPEKSVPIELAAQLQPDVLCPDCRCALRRIYGLQPPKYLTFTRRAGEQPIDTGPRP